MNVMDFRTWPSLFVVDVEGNGAGPPDLVEVAVLPIREGRPDTIGAGAWLVRPPRPVTVRAARVHGLTNHRLSTAPPWPDIADDVHGLLGTAWICAHNAHTDYRVLTAHLPDWRPAGVLDTLRLARPPTPACPATASTRSSPTSRPT
jgi:DNA polymerase-3 subunit epsilon/exodeoxyribonuclease X